MNPTKKAQNLHFPTMQASSQQPQQMSENYHSRLNQGFNSRTSDLQSSYNTNQTNPFRKQKEPNSHIVTGSLQGEKEIEIGQFQEEPDYKLLQNINPQLFFQVKSFKNISELGQAMQLECSKGGQEKERRMKSELEFIGQFFNQFNAFEKIDLAIKTLSSYLQQVTYEKKLKSHQASSEEIDKIMKKKFQKIQSLLSQLIQISEISQRDLEQSQKKENDLAKNSFQMLKRIQDLEKEAIKYQEENSDLQDKMYMLDKKIDEKRNKINLDQFERIIIKMQMAENSFFRYGGRQVLGDYSKFDYFEQEGTLVKWKNRIDHVTLLDLKIFVLTLLIPMTRFIFNNFSYQSNLYKVMLGFGDNLGIAQTQSSLEMLRTAIHKRLTIQNFPSIKACINNSRKKRIIIVCKPNAFTEIMEGLIEQINGFSTELMAISKVELTKESEEFFTTKLRVRKLQIHYVYEKNSVQAEIEVFHCPVEVLTQEDLLLLRKKTSDLDSVFVWIEIPKVLHCDQIGQIKDIHKMLEKCKNKGFAAPKLGKTKSKK